MNSSEVGRSSPSSMTVKVPSPFDPHERAGVRQCRITLEIAVPDALRQGVQRAAPAEFHVDEQRRAGGDLRGGRRLRP